MAELQQKKTSLARLRRMLFGAPTEKTRSVLEASASQELTSTANPTADSEAEPLAKAPAIECTPAIYRLSMDNTILQ